jgi:hypothetical protein
MIELQNWIEQNRFAGEPWLVLGKGPTFAKIKEVDLQQYNTFALNHVVRETKVDVAHIIDIDVVEPLGTSLLENCKWLIMPRIPHVKCFASEYMTLADWLKCIPVLQEADEQGKLITYSFSHEAVDQDPWTVTARYFSSEAALGILARMGVKKIRSLGIDGGKNYSKNFEDLKDTLLVNSQPNFDLQFEQLEAIAQQFDIDYAPLFQPALAPAPSAPQPLQNSHSSVTVAEKVSKMKVGQQSLILSTTSNTEAPGPEQMSTRTALLNLNADSLVNASTPGASAISNKQTTAARVQQLECDYRIIRAELLNTSEELAATAKELSITSDRLGWAGDEIKEYRIRITQLENDMHGLYKSLSWKLGRLITKPAEAIVKLIKPSPNPHNRSHLNSSCTKLTED